MSRRIITIVLVFSILSPIYALAGDGDSLIDDVQIDLVDFVIVREQAMMVLKLTNESDKPTSISMKKIEEIAGRSHFVSVDGKVFSNFSETPIGLNDSHFPVIRVPPRGNIVLVVSPPSSSLLADFKIDKKIKLKSKLIRSNSIFSLKRENGDKIHISRE